MLGILGAGLMLPRELAMAVEVEADDLNNAWTIDGSNFHAIYDDAALRDQFSLFLENVYSIYPPDRFHGLIASATQEAAADRDIYLAGQNRLSEIKPLARNLRYSLPALMQQTRTIGRQIVELLDGRKSIDGYMEIGSKGGYLGYVNNKIKVRGDIVMLNTDAATYELGDVFERRSLIKLGRFVELADYAPISEEAVASHSLDVVCNPIGFHHSPPAKRDEFVRSIRRCLRNGGKLIVRDHDVNSSAMNHMVALAHDVFNMGLEKDWQYNLGEIRNFTSLAELTGSIEQFGFRFVDQVIYQKGDPTHNALFGFVAV